MINDTFIIMIMGRNEKSVDEVCGLYLINMINRVVDPNLQFLSGLGSITRDSITITIAIT